MSWLIVVLGMEVSQQFAKQQQNILMEAFDVAIFIWMYEVERGGADEFMGLVTCIY